MQEGIIQLGHVLLGEGDILSNLVENVQLIKNKKIQHVLKIMFSTNPLDLKIDVVEEINEDTCKKYLHIGGAPGANSKQWYATSKNNFYHLSETIVNMTEKDLGEKTNLDIKTIANTFYVDLGSEFKSSKNRYILDLKMLGATEKSMLDVANNVKQELIEKSNGGEVTEKNIKEGLKKKFLELFEGYLKDEFSIGFKEIGLYTIFLDGEAISSKKEYREAVTKEKSVHDKKNSSSNDNGLKCSNCGSNKGVTKDIKCNIKFYTTNLPIFASELDKKNYSRNMLLCEQCLNELWAGEKYLSNSLSTKLSNFQVYILPHFILGENIDKEDLDKYSQTLKNSFNTICNYSSIDELKNVIEDKLIMEAMEDNTYYLINLIFYKQVQQATKIQKFIKDINPSIFFEIAVSLGKISSIFMELFQKDSNFKLGILYYLVPIRFDDKGIATQYRSLLEFYEGIFTRRPMDKKRLINNVIRCCKLQHFNEIGYNVSSGNIVGTIINGNMYIKFLEDLNNFRKEKAMDTSNLIVNEKIKAYIEEMNYDEEKTALFLLGNLIGAVGYEQSKRNPEGNKAVLNKLNFGGVDKTKIIRLTNDILNKLRQEKILKYYEKTWAQCKNLLDKNMATWSLDKNENLFYILSGYGYNSMSAAMNKKGGEKDE